MGEMTAKQHAKAASVAHCDLNTLYGVIALLEGGTISVACYATVEKIIRLCKQEAQRCLHRHDQHMDALP